MDSEVNESLSSRSSPADTALDLASQKAQAVARLVEHGTILAADTVIDLDGEVFGKPRDSRDARRMLARLRSRPHDVVTALAVFDHDLRNIRTSLVRTKVLMRNYSSSEIDNYIDTGEPFGKAGSYAIQGIGSAMVADIRGCYYNVIGLPLCETICLLGDSLAVEIPASRACLDRNGGPCARTRKHEIRKL